MKKAIVFCGTKGSGKTFYVKSNWSQYTYIECDDPMANFTTYSLLELTIAKATGLEVDSDVKEQIKSFSTLVQTSDGIIIDNAELINENTLKIVVNTAIHFNKNIICVFDLQYDELHLQKTFITMLNWDLIDINNVKKDFYVSDECLCEFISHNYSYISSNEYSKIIKISNRNFNNIKLLMWLNKIKNEESSYITKDIEFDYISYFVNKGINKLTEESSDILKKASVIGEIFSEKILSDENGFHIVGAENLLNDLEKMKIFIKKYIYKEFSYNFISYDIYRCIFSLLSSEQKNECLSTLKKYYIKTFYAIEESSHIDLLIKLKHACINLGDNSMVYSINHILLNKYTEINDTNKILEIICELIETVKVQNDNCFLNYLQMRKLTLLMDIGNFKEALNLIDDMRVSKRYNGSTLYLEYYYVQCQYNCGYVDDAYEGAKQLVETLQRTSFNGNKNMVIYPLAYSIMSSIQNHLGKDDLGIHYYRLALNYSYNNINDKTFYYDILKKCNMFFDNIISYEYMKQCIDYFEKQQENFKAAKVYLNLATEKLFNTNNEDEKLLRWFMTAKNTFESMSNENLAYIKNNLAIYYVMSLNDYEKAINELETSLFIGISDFTLMTIYLNLSMCCYHINKDEKFQEYYAKFINYEEKIGGRKNKTLYESMYRVIAKLIFDDINIIEKSIICEELLKNNKLPDFFVPIINDINNRFNINNVIDYNYNSDKRFYKYINDNNIFLAELRFWD